MTSSIMRLKYQRRIPEMVSLQMVITIITRRTWLLELGLRKAAAVELRQLTGNSRVGPYFQPMTSQSLPTVSSQFHLRPHPL